MDQADPQPTAAAAMLSELAQAEAWIRDCLSKGDPRAAEAWERFKTLREALVGLGVKVPPLLRDTALPREFQIQLFTVQAGKATHRPELDTRRLSAPEAMDMIRSIARVHHAIGIRCEPHTDEHKGERTCFDVYKYPPGAYAYPTEADPVDAVAVMICPLEPSWKVEISFKVAGDPDFIRRPENDFGPVSQANLNRRLAEFESMWRAMGAEPEVRIESETEQVIRYAIPATPSTPSAAAEFRVIEVPPLVGDLA